MSRGKKAAAAAGLLTILICIGAYAVYRLYLCNAAYVKGDRAYEAIASQVISRENQPGDTAEREEIQSRSITSDSGEEDGDPAVTTVDFTELKSLAPDAVAWLYCPDTAIDYPVMAASDYTHYLYHLPDGTYNINGSLFLDYNSAADFSDGLSVIYGHNMKSGKMFGSLTKYKTQSYYDEHPYLYLYTEEGNYRIALIYGAVVSARRWRDMGFVSDKSGLLRYAKSHTTFETTAEYSLDDSFVVLSTCSYEFDDARFFVVGVLQPMDAAI